MHQSKLSLLDSSAWQMRMELTSLRRLVDRYRHIHNNNRREKKMVEDEKENLEREM